MTSSSRFDSDFNGKKAHDLRLAAGAAHEVLKRLHDRKYHYNKHEAPSLKFNANPPFDVHKDCVGIIKELKREVALYSAQQRDCNIIEAQHYTSLIRLDTEVDLLSDILRYIAQFHTVNKSIC